METDLTKKVAEKLNDLVDEETGRKFGELNLVTEVSEPAEGTLRIRFRPLSAYSPLAVDVGRSIMQAASSVDGVKSARVECVGHMMDDLVNRMVNKPELTQRR